MIKTVSELKAVLLSDRNRFKGFKVKNKDYDVRLQDNDTQTEFYFKYINGGPEIEFVGESEYEDDGGLLNTRGLNMSFK